MSETLDRIASIGIVPVIANIPSVEACDNLAQALIRGGVPVMEITFRMKDAEKYIAHVREHYPEINVGAGTVLTLEQAGLAVKAGAQFFVAPGLDEEIVKFAASNGVDMIPGVSTASEISKALNLGLHTLKFFPAENCGGAGTIKSLCGPFKNVRFIPTGGVNLNNIGDYFALPGVAACGGTYMLGKHVEKGEWDEITALCRKSVQTMLDLKLVHVGINGADEADALGIAGALSSLLLTDQGKNGSSSVFVGSFAEVMKGKGLGTHGHLGFSTRNIDRTVAYYRAIGTEFSEDSAKYDESGKLKAIYFKNEIAGFAVHLVRA